MVVLSPLLDLAGFYREPFLLATEESIEIAIEDKDEIVRERIDVLVIGLTQKSRNYVITSAAT
ncbi:MULTISPECIES: hypothetical protein [unclassified Tolypothrix]|uniref:hypothetical protein n=1 Tax=unclassified Tolypothrix TaxID=2649714 RepID=UPI0005EAC233|nr:hypothetical protein FDUTEX481_00796 [Tolypothrix sp. PCC 7601]BAY92138.1 hypothetical protein NIES3275_41700 [Microchaete diplosiphon NIES-3275]